MPPVVSHQGGRPENRWIYSPTTQEFSRIWTASYFDLYEENGYTRAVKWTLVDLRRESNTVVEVWQWQYVE